jgi:hypothetical protein
MKEITRKLIEVARRRRTLWGMNRSSVRGFPNPNRKAVADLAHRERARLGRKGLLRRINHRGRPLAALSEVAGS